ncbi:MAG TPA: L,D-transpeptidase family protein [Thermoanaerobaculia bacterium]|jgi:murein L,D-transpeptidase YafK|nr:L,D-transpeptidase family protein [Thermoanaerobaculia bacterium]
MKKTMLAAAVGVALLAALFAWANASPAPLSPGTKIDRVLVLKSQHRLFLLDRGRSVASFPVALGRGPSGPKVREGDGRTPEGVYTIDFHNSASAFYRSLHVSYPQARDVARARRLGASPGGSIMVHGLPPRLAFVGRLQRLADWTNGCIALSNPEMRQVFNAVRDGTQIEIRP